MRQPTPVIVTTTYSDTPLDPRALWTLMERAEKSYWARRALNAKSRPENKRASANSKRVTTPA